MKILVDPPKRQQVLLRRGLDMADVTLDFFAEAVVVDGRHGRLIAIGKIEGTAYAVVFKPLGTEAISLVTMRRASKRERRLL